MVEESGGGDVASSAGDELDVRGWKVEVEKLTSIFQGALRPHDAEKIVALAEATKGTGNRRDNMKSGG